MTASAAPILHALAHPEESLRDTPLLAVVAHPDDEVLGLGGRLPHLHRLHIVFVTDGAPRDMVDAHRLGFATQAEYAAARVREADAALAALGVGPERVHRLGFVDQEVVQRVEDLTDRCCTLLDEIAPEAVITHAYEGGHPDHDAVAMAVHLACRKRKAAGLAAPAVIEFAGYHDPDGSGRMATSTFLPAAVPAVAVRLKEAEREQKCRALACYATQAEMVGLFCVEKERFRAAPDYQFTAPPHPWRPFYEHFVRGLDGAAWLAFARRTLERFRLRGLL